MPLNVVSEQSASPVGPPPKHETDSPPSSDQQVWLAWLLVGVVAGARGVLDVAWGIQSSLPARDLTPVWLELVVSLGIVLAAVAWCRRMGGGTLAMVGTAVAVTAAPGLWLAGWQFSSAGLMCLLAVFTLPLLLFGGRELPPARTERGVWPVLACAALTAVFLVLGTDSANSSSLRLAELSTLGPVPLLVAVFTWSVLVAQWGLPVPGRQPARQLPNLVRVLSLWVAATSLCVTFALLTHRFDAQALAALWVAIPFGLGLELLRRGALGRAISWLVLLGLLVQLAVLGWRLIGV